MKLLLTLTALFKFEDTNTWIKADKSVKTFEPTFLVDVPLYLTTTLPAALTSPLYRESIFSAIVDTNIDDLAPTILTEVKTMVQKGKDLSSNEDIEDLPEWSKLNEVLTGLATAIKKDILTELVTTKKPLNLEEEHSSKKLIEPFKDEKVVERLMKDFRTNYVNELLELLPKNIRLSRLEGILKVVKLEVEPSGNAILQEAPFLEPIESVHFNFPLGVTSIGGLNTSTHYCSKGNLSLKMSLKNGTPKEKILLIPYPFVDPQLVKRHDNRHIEKVIFAGTPKENMLNFLQIPFSSVINTTITPIYMESKKFYKPSDVRFDCYDNRGGKILFEMTNPVLEKRKELRDSAKQENREGGEENG